MINSNLLLPDSTNFDDTRAQAIALLNEILLASMARPAIGNNIGTGQETKRKSKSCHLLLLFIDSFASLSLTHSLVEWTDTHFLTHKKWWRCFVWLEAFVYENLCFAAYDDDDDHSIKVRWGQVHYWLLLLPLPPTLSFFFGWWTELDTSNGPVVCVCVCPDTNLLSCWLKP